MQQDRGGIRACNNNNMRNPRCREGLHVLLLLHALISCLAAYMLPSSPVLLHIYCTCFSTFWHCHPYILQHFNGNVFTPLFHWFFVAYSLANIIVFAFMRAPPILLLVVMRYARV